MFTVATWVAWFVLHGGGGHESGGLVTFETALGGLVALLIVVGTLTYLGVLDLPGGSGDEESEAGVGD